MFVTSHYRPENIPHLDQQMSDHVSQAEEKMVSGLPLYWSGSIYSEVPLYCSMVGWESIEIRTQDTLVMLLALAASLPSTSGELCYSGVLCQLHSYGSSWDIAPE